MKIAIIQSGPVHLDLSATLKKAIQLIDKAAAQKAQLIVFGECWFSGYPAWIDYCSDSVTLGDETLNSLCAKAKEHEIALVFGANEAIRKGKGNGTVYNSLFIINEAGEIANHHRKLMPTYTEKLIHGWGDGAGLKAVDTKIGRVGGLICWEHWMPLTRQAMHDEAEDIHIALWPTVKEMNQIACRQYAHEGRCFVIAVGSVMKASETPATLPLPKQLKKQKDEYVMRGGSSVIGPNGEFLLDPQYDYDGILYCELPPVSSLTKEKMNLATSGHYNRYDVFDFSVNKKRQV